MQQEQAISIAELQQELIASRIALSELESSHADILAKANSGMELSEPEGTQLESLVMSHWGWAFFGQRRWEAMNHPAVNFPLVGLVQFLMDNPAALRVYRIREKRMKDARSRLGLGGTIQDRFDSQVDEYLAVLMKDKN